jgi:pimeloyl-ACP methyl ester carboxylesterase
MFVSDYLTLGSGRKLYYAHSAPAKPASKAPVVAIHGLGGSSAFWLPALQCSGLTQDRDVYAYDMDGHGQSDFSGREPSIQNYVDDIGEVLDTLNLGRVILIGHSMNGVSQLRRNGQSGGQAGRGGQVCSTRTSPRVDVCSTPPAIVG